jgi:hypothetical protein
MIQIDQYWMAVEPIDGSFKCEVQQADGNKPARI